MNTSPHSGPLSLTSPALLSASTCSFSLGLPGPPGCWLGLMERGGALPLSGRESRDPSGVWSGCVSDHLTCTPSPQQMPRGQGASPRPTCRGDSATPSSGQVEAVLMTGHSTVACAVSLRPAGCDLKSAWGMWGGRRARASWGCEGRMAGSIVGSDAAVRTVIRASVAALGVRRGWVSWYYAPGLWPRCSS